MGSELVVLMGGVSGWVEEGGREEGGSWRGVLEGVEDGEFRFGDVDSVPCFGGDDVARVIGAEVAGVERIRDVSCVCGGGDVWGVGVVG